MSVTTFKQDEPSLKLKLNLRWTEFKKKIVVFMTSVPYIGRIIHPIYSVNPIVQAGTLRAAIQPLLLNFPVHPLERLDDEVHVAVGEDTQSPRPWIS